jgi:sulfonate transport system substrate-binding protein
VQGGGLFLISDKWAAEHPTKIADAVAALWESQQWVRRNQKEAAAIEAEFLKVEPRIVEVSFKVLSYDPLIDSFTDKSLQSTADYLADEKLISAPIKLDPHLVELNKVTKEVRLAHPELLK